MNLERVEIIGFGSIQNLVYQLDTVGVNILSGKNGTGKTTILNAIAWCLYKRLIKANATVEPWPHIINERIYKGTMVTIIFNDGTHTYCVRRCKGYDMQLPDGKKGADRLYITMDGKELSINLRNCPLHNFGSPHNDVRGSTL